MSTTKNIAKEQVLQVIDGGKGTDNKDAIKINTLKVFKSELVNVEYLNADDLFSEFDSIKVITFSYDINFMDHLMQFFKYGEIILGADYMAQKDGKLNDKFPYGKPQTDEVARGSGTKSMAVRD